MTGQEAIEALEAAFAAKAAAGHDRPIVGVFGNGVPLSLISAAGCLPADVKSAPDNRIFHVEPAVSRFLEPFLDDHARVFLHRLFGGDFRGMAAIVFPRDDAAALAAYQYATELRRQGLAKSSMPRLVLWNLVHGKSDAIAAFNARQAKRLGEELAAIGGTAPADGDALVRVMEAEHARTAALSRLETLVSGDSPLVSGGEAMRWRNAGRYLEAGRHAALLDAACEEAASRQAGRSGRRIGLVGTALDDPRVYGAIESFGTIVCDLQPFGSVWPGPSSAAMPDEVVRAEAGDPLAARARPELAPLEALVARLVRSRCDVVVAQYDQNDDTFGWDLPGLRDRLSAHAIPLVDLGFRDPRPDDAWLHTAQSRLAAALEAEHA